MHKICWLLLCLSLAACQNRQIKPQTTPLSVQPLKEKVWSMSGKMSVSDGQEGGSGSLKWSESNNQVHAIFKAPLGQGSWELDESLGLISDSKGQSWKGSDMSALISQQVGWPVPWNALKHSLKGWQMGEPLTSNDGQTLQFIKAGWLVEWKQIKSVNGQMLPHKIYIKKKPYSIKISVKKWQW